MSIKKRGIDMAVNTINNSDLANYIKERRMELELTVEEAAHRAGVGVKTWYRYESGSAIRTDKCKGVCRALQLTRLPGQSTTDFAEYEKLEAWSPFIAENYGTVSAILFAVGSDMLIDYIGDELDELSACPRGTHVGQLSCSWLKEHLPQQFLMEYDYLFVYRMKVKLNDLRKRAASGLPIIAHSVIEELLIFLSNDLSQFLIETDENVGRLIQEDNAYYDEVNLEELDEEEIEPVYNESWVFDLFGDDDILIALYSDWLIDKDHIYHFEHWFDNQFYLETDLFEKL